MKIIKKPISIILFMAILLSVIPFTALNITVSAASYLVKVGDIGISETRCKYKDSDEKPIFIIYGLPDTGGNININPEPGYYLRRDGDINRIDNTPSGTNIAFGGASGNSINRMYTFKIYKIDNAQIEYTFVLYVTANNINHCLFQYDLHYTGASGNGRYILDATDTAIFNTALAYNGGTTSFSYNIKIFRCNGYYDPTGLTGGTSGRIYVPSFSFIDYKNNRVEPWWPTGSHVDGATYTCTTGTLNISGSNIFPAQYQIKFPYKTGSAIQTSYFITLSGAPVIPISDSDVLYRRWNDMGSILKKITYTNPNGQGGTVDISKLENLAGISTTVRNKISSRISGYVGASATLQQAFTEMYLFYADSMDTGALCTNTNDYRRFGGLIRDVLNSSGAGYLQSLSPAMPVPCADQNKAVAIQMIP